MALGNGSGRRQREACDMRCSERGGVCDGSGRVPGVPLVGVLFVVECAAMLAAILLSLLLYIYTFVVFKGYCYFGIILSSSHSYVYGFNV